MLAKLSVYEWRLLRADRTLWTLTAFFAAVVAYGVYNGVAWTRFQAATIGSVQREEATRLDSLRGRLAAIAAGDTAGLKPWLDPRSASTVGGNIGARYTVLPPAPLAALAVGQSDLYPYYARISTRIKQTFVVNDEIENPTNLLAGRFDLSFVIIYIYPLLILALSYNLVSAEREQGTLALLLSQPVRVRRVIGGKVLVRAALVVALALGFTVAGALVAGVPLAAAGVLPRLALWAAVVAAYGAFWFAAALAVNALGRSSAFNAVALLGVWLATVVLVPSLYNVAITTLRPSPSRVLLTQTLREASNAAQERGTLLLAKYYNDHPELMPAGGKADTENYAARAIAVQEDVERSIEPALRDFDARLVSQQALADRYRFVSPAVVTQAALYDVAGTGVHRYTHFQRLVDAYHGEWRRFWYPRIFGNAPLTEADYDAIPRFEFREEPLRSVVLRTVPGLVALLVPAALLAVAAVAGLRRVSLAER